MKGDFSILDYEPEANFTGVLHQQGRVLLDRDWNESDRITRHLRGLLGRDTIGANVAAVPASEVDSLKVTQAVSDGSAVDVTLLPGRLWVDGLPLHVPGTDPVTLPAEYYGPPVSDPEPDAGSIGAGVRDAVVLEVWEEALNAFQEPEGLLEPALGGVDTTERVRLVYALRLLRLASGEDCGDVAGHFAGEFDTKGRLTVTPGPAIAITGDCPVEAGGGYTGFEHFLYRIEIADPEATGGARFKWSRFGAGLVGRGTYDSAADEVTITANDQMINQSGLTDFYLEALRESPGGHWQVLFTANATLSADGKLSLTNVTGTWPSTPGDPTAFFRLWDGVALVNDFTAVGPSAVELQDGIHLQFEAATPGDSKYAPGDYWTFPVRAAGVGFDPSVWPSNAPPQGVVYHRAPLAVLNWTGGPAVTITEPDDIQDCRDVFRPLTNQTICCSFTVGDGVSSHGDFDSIEDAVRHLPGKGGEICLLPGLHHTNTRIEQRQNVRITGCGKQTRVIPREGTREAPIFHVLDSECVWLENMDLVTLGGVAIILSASQEGALREVEVAHNRILACKEAIHVERGLEIKIHHNRIRMLDKADAGVGIFMLAEDGLIERNDIGVVPAEKLPPPPETPPGEEQPDPADPCADLELVYTNVPFFVAYVAAIWRIAIALFPVAPYKALGGIQIAGGAERIKILENVVNGGASNGITLGGAPEISVVPTEEQPKEEPPSVIANRVRAIEGQVLLNNQAVEDASLTFSRADGFSRTAVSRDDGYFTEGLEPGDYKVAVATPGYKIQNVSSVDSPDFGLSYRIDLAVDQRESDDLLAFIYEIEIDRNEISNMGLSGIGVPLVTQRGPITGPGTVGVPGTMTNTGATTDASASSVAMLARTNVSASTKALAPFLARLGNPVMDIRIHRNFIFNCLRNPLEGELRAAAQRRGFGGISLGLCDTVSITENRIEENGTSHITPVCGIFIAFGEQVDISHNLVSDNGPFVEGDQRDLETGQRGGIVARVSSISLLEFLVERNRSLTSGRPAGRVHDNIVRQPVGQALRILSIGAFSACNNHLNAERMGTDIWERLAGSLAILNLGGERPLPNGNTLFNGNQVRLGSDSESYAAQLIWTRDDLGYDANQSDALHGGLKIGQFSLMVNSILIGATVRASDNRYAETPAAENDFKASLLSLSEDLNNTTNNHGDHCIFAKNGDAARPEITTGNQVLDDRLCQEVNSGVMVTGANFLSKVAVGQ